ncbi:hypothetical protein NA56DRAFT_586396, partial [Hyaloscypha hepaticicola]
LYINYRGFNKVIIKNRYPLSLINEILNRLVKVKIFTNLNLKDIYYYIYIYNSYKYFEYLIILFGLVNILVIF